MKEIPFKYHGNSVDPDPNNCHRLKVYRQFIGNDFIPGKSLDIGEPGYVSNQLAVTDNTAMCDLNYNIHAPQYEYDVITCFEVLNHVMNPLMLMEKICKFLKPGGKIYLSVPKLWLISWHHCKHNFVMYDPRRLATLFEYAGFDVVRSETHNPWPWWLMFYGFRPMFRVLLNRIQLFELMKA